MRAVAVILFIFILAGCSTAERSRSPSEASGPAAEPGIPPGAPAPAPPPPAAEAPAPPPPAASLTLEEALRTAFARNPDLAAVRRSEDVSRAAREVSRTYPHNPQLALDVRPLTRETGGENGEVFVSASLLQEVELARQGRSRREVGDAELDRTLSLIQDQETRVAAETGRRFFIALSLRSLCGLGEAEAARKEELLGVVERRFQAGLAAAADLGLARVEARSARQQADLAKAREDVAIRELQKLLALREEEPLLPSGDLEGWPWPPPPEPAAAPGKDEQQVLLLRHLEEMAEARPDVRVAEADLRARSARADLASASRIPNIAIGPIYEKDESGTHFLGVETQVPLPIFDTGGPLLRQRQAEARQGLESLTQLRAKARLEVRAALARYEEVWRLAERFRRDLGEGFEPELRRVRDQYEAGLTSILEVYAAQSNVQRARGNLLDAQLELALAAVDLSAAAALPAEALLARRPVEGPRK